MIPRRVGLLGPVCAPDCATVAAITRIDDRARTTPGQTRSRPRRHPHQQHLRRRRPRLEDGRVAGRRRLRRDRHRALGPGPAPPPSSSTITPSPGSVSPSPSPGCRRPSLPETGDSRARRRRRPCGAGSGRAIGRAAQAIALPASCRGPGRRVIAEQVEPADVWQAESRHHAVSGGRAARTLRRARRLRRQRHRQRGRAHGPPAGTLEAAAAPPRAAPGARGRCRRHGQRPLRAGARPHPRPAGGRRRAQRGGRRGRGCRAGARRRPAQSTASTGSLACRPIDASSSTSARSCAAAACASSSRPSRSSTTPTSWWPASGPTTSATRTIAAALPHADRIHFLGSVATRRDPRLDAWRRRLGHARAARHAQPSPQHADQALRRHGRRRPGGGQRPAGHRAHRRRDRLWRPLRPDRSGRHRACHPRGHRRAGGRAHGPAPALPAERPDPATRGSTRRASCCASTARSGV